MLILIHGDQPEAARTQLAVLRQEAEGKDIRVLSGKTIDRTQLVQALESTSMFGGDVLVIIERFLTNAKKREKAFGDTLIRITEAARTIDIVLYEEKEMDKTTVAKLGADAKTYLFKTPAVIFKFLDSLRPGNAKESLELLTQVTKTEPAEIVFTLLVRRIRQLIMLADNVPPDGLQSWQAGRLTNQARHFTMEQLIAMHTGVLEMDIAIKTGNTPFTLTQLLEQFITTL